MWKSHILSILYFLKKIWLLMIFGTLFSEKCPLLGNFYQNLFLPLSSTQMNKIWSKFNLELLSVHFWFMCVEDLGKNRFWSKLPKNGRFSLNKVPKIINNPKFFKKYKMLRICDFHKDFQFRAKKSLPRDLKMGLAHPWQFLGKCCKVDGSRNPMDGFGGSL